ncbi:hypothetical protein BU16DRAFT_543947 [Lophium mytilinum]|uniref:Uncharacterized protein n=1 Tax=Lophium mytilinum TaxID=390894 RepID=A0A6A6QE22_9PEZI|nr:hypothetical protein BU16DRAFT_543947 [Lophium mytilinum]
MSRSHAADRRAASQPVADAFRGRQRQRQHHPTIGGDSGLSAAAVQATAKMYKESVAEEARKYLEPILNGANYTIYIQSSTGSSPVATDSNSSSVQCAPSSASSVSLFLEPQYEAVAIPPPYPRVRGYVPTNHQGRPHDPGVGSGHSPPDNQQSHHQHARNVHHSAPADVPMWYIFELDGAVQLLHEQLEVLKKTLGEHEEHAVISTTHIGHMQEKMHEEDNELAILRGQVQEFSLQISDLQDQLTMSAGHFNAKCDELEDVQNEICGLEEDLTKLRKEKDEENARLRKSNQMFMGLHKLQKDRADLALAGVPISDDKATSVMQQEIDEKDLEISQLRQQISTLQVENENLVVSNHAEVMRTTGAHWDLVQCLRRDQEPVIPKPKVVQLLETENYDNLPIGYTVENCLPVAKYGRVQVLTTGDAPYTGPMRPATPLTQKERNGIMEQNELLLQFWQWRNPIVEGLDVPDIIREHFEKLDEEASEKERREAAQAEAEHVRPRLPGHDQLYDANAYIDAMSMPSAPCSPVPAPPPSPPLSPSSAPPAFPPRYDTYPPDRSELPMVPKLPSRTDEAWSVERLETAYQMSSYAINLGRARNRQPIVSTFTSSRGSQTSKAERIKQRANGRVQVSAFGSPYRVPIGTFFAAAPVTAAPLVWGISPQKHDYVIPMFVDPIEWLRGNHYRSFGVWHELWVWVSSPEVEYRYLGCRRRATRLWTRLNECVYEQHIFPYVI